MVCLHFHISEHPLLYIALSCLDITGAVWVWELPAIWGACSACFLFCHSSGCKMDEPFRTSSCSFATSATVIPDCTLDLKWSGNRESCCTPVMTGCLLVVHDGHPGPGHLEKYNSGSSEHGVPGNVKAHLRLGKVLGSVVALTVWGNFCGCKHVCLHVRITLCFRKKILYFRKNSEDLVEMKWLPVYVCVAYDTSRFRDSRTFFTS